MSTHSIAHPHPTPRGAPRQSIERFALRPERVRVYVWERPVRLAHWLIFFSIVVLSFTGYYIYNPFIIARGPTPYLMASMRFIHELTAWVFIFAVLLRLYWYLYANQWSRLNQFIPMSRERWRDMGETAKFYSFFRWRPTRHIGHNALAGAAYAAVYFLALLEIFTGLVLFNQHVHNPVLNASVAWSARYIDIQWITTTHFLLMFAFWLFLIHHLYSGLLTASEEENGLMDSIFTGFKFVSPAVVRAELPGASIPESAPPDAERGGRAVGTAGQAPPQGASALGTPENGAEGSEISRSGGPHPESNEARPRPGWGERGPRPGRASSGSRGGANVAVSAREAPRQSIELEDHQ